MNRKRWVATAGLLCLLTASLLLGREAYLTAKGMLAQVLINQAFQETLQDGEPHRPWSWADMAPVAVLEAPGQQVRRTVLSGASGESMAFGVGHISGTAPPNRQGNCVLAGHRDGAFAFLADLSPGDRIDLRTPGGVKSYKVTAAQVVNQGDYQVLDRGREDRLTLVTCWPFHGLTRSSRRYVVTCAPVNGIRYAHASSVDSNLASAGCSGPAPDPGSRGVGRSAGLRR